MTEVGMSEINSIEDLKRYPDGTEFTLNDDVHFIPPEIKEKKEEVNKN